MPFQTGNKEWFINVFNQHYEYIRNYLYYLSGDMDWSEDLVQDVFLKVWERREKIRDETLKPYLYTIARNFYLKDASKKKNALQFINSQTDFTDNESPEFKVEVEEFHRKLENAISLLPEKCRAIYLMNRIDKLTYRQIAASLSVSEKAIEKQMSKALLLLRENLGRNV